MKRLIAFAAIGSLLTAPLASADPPRGPPPGHRGPPGHSAPHHGYYGGYRYPPYYHHHHGHKNGNDSDDAAWAIGGLVVGAIIGELPSGIRDGLGRAILNFNQYYISGPERLWAAIIASAAVGIVFFLIMSILERYALRGRKAVESV